jgi:hypothetical protein
MREKNIPLMFFHFVETNPKTKKLHFLQPKYIYSERERDRERERERERNLTRFSAKVRFFCGRWMYNINNLGAWSIKSSSDHSFEKFRMSKKSMTTFANSISYYIELVCHCAL